jgi:hypothetical protein
MPLIKEHIRMTKTQTGNKVNSLSLVHETTIPYTPEEYGSVERDTGLSLR